MKTKISLLTLFLCAATETMLFADNEVYDLKTITNDSSGYTNRSLINSSWKNSSISGCFFWGSNLTGALFTEAFISNSVFASVVSGSSSYVTTLSNAKFNDAMLEYVNFDGSDMRNVSFSGATLTYCSFTSGESVGMADLTDACFIGSQLTGISLTDTNMTDCDFSGAIIVDSDFSLVDSVESISENTCFSGSIIKNTGFKNRNFTSADFKNCSFEVSVSGATLADVFLGATLEFVDFRGAIGVDLSGAKSTQNCILPDGRISNLGLSEGGDFFIEEHVPRAGAESVSVKLSGDNFIAEGARLTVRENAILELNPASSSTILRVGYNGSEGSLVLSENSELHFNCGNFLSVEVLVGSKGCVTFSETANLVIDFAGTFTNDTRFSVLTWESGASVKGVDVLTKGGTLSLLVDGVAYDSTLWDFSTNGNSLTIFGVSGTTTDPDNPGGSGGTDEPIIPDDPVIPEDPKNIAITADSQSVLLSDADCKANFDSSLKTFSGSVSGSGELHSSYNVTFSGDARAYTGTTYVDAGVFTIAENAKLGTGAFEVAGTLKLSGVREFSNTTSGKGEINVFAGTTTFSNDIGVQTLSVSQGATAVLNSGVDLVHTNAKVKIAGTLKLIGNRDIDMTGVSGAGLLATTGTVSLSGNVSAFSGGFEIGGVLRLSDSRNFVNATSGNGKISLVSGANVSFEKAVGVKTLAVEQGTTLRGNVSLTHEDAALSLTGTLVLNADKGEKVLLGGGTALLASSAKLDLVGGNTSVRATGAQIAALEKGEQVSIFENGTVSGNVVSFLETDVDLASYAQNYAVIYDTSNGLRVQVIKNAGTLIGGADTSGLSASFVNWALKDADHALNTLTPGFVSATAWNNSLSGGNDPLLKAFLSNDTETARSILERLSPKSYAAMVAMPVELFNFDARSISARLEQRRYDRFSKRGQWEFFAELQANSVENNTATDTPTFDFDTTGLLAGADYKLDQNTMLGVALGASTGEAKVHDNGGKIEATDFRVTGFAGKTIENYFVNAGAQLGYASYDVKRKTDYGNASGDTTGWSAGLFADAGTVITLSESKKIYATPYLGLAYMHTRANSFTESGSDKAFDADEISGDSLRARLGCGFSWGFTASGAVWRLGVDVAYSHDFLGDEVDIDVTAQDGTSITETARALPEDMFSIGPSFNVDVSSSSSIYGSYTFNAGTDSSVNHSANLGFRMRF